MQQITLVLDACAHDLENAFPQEMFLCRKRWVGTLDDDLAADAIRSNAVLVTADYKDFTKIYCVKAKHPGVIFTPSLNKDFDLTALRDVTNGVAKCIAQQRIELENRAVFIPRAGDALVVNFCLDTSSKIVAKATQPEQVKPERKFELVMSQQLNTLRQWQSGKQELSAINPLFSSQILSVLQHAHTI